MASFDIQPPQINAPDWTRVSRAIPEPEHITKADASKGIALSTLGTGIEEAAKLYDTSEKSYLKDKVTTGVDKLRDDYIDAYTNIRNQQQGLIPDQPQTLAQADAPSIPGRLKSGLDQATKLGIAQAQNMGHVNDTLYDMNLHSLAKQLRTQYPGYKDYIDDTIKSVSGVDPANAVMRNLLEDINRNASNAKSEHDKVTTMVRAAVTGGVGGIGPNGIPNAAILSSMWDRGQVTPDQVYAYIAKYSAKDWQRTQEMNERANDQGKLSDIQTKAEQSFAKTVGHDTMAALDITAIAGGTQTAQGLIDVINKANAEGSKIDPARLDQALMGLTGLRTNLIAAATRKANEPDANGQTTVGLIGPDKVKNHIAEQVKPLDEYIKYISDEKLGFAHTASRITQSIDEGTHLDLYNQPKVGAQLRIIAGMAKIAPQWGDAMLKAGLLSNLPQDLIPVYQGKLAAAVAQIDPLNPATAKADIQQAKAAGVAPSTRLIDNYTYIPRIIADPKASDEVKLNVAKYAFDPKNWGLMDELKMDYTNQKGQPVPGKYAAFDRIFSDEIIDNMWKLRQQGGDGRVAWDNMKKMGEIEFPNLFREDLHNIVRMGETYKNQMQTTIHPLETPISGGAAKFDMHWDNENNRFLELPVKGRTFGGAGADTTDNQFAASANVIIRRINSAIGQLGNIQSKEGGNTSAYVLGLLHNADPAVRSITQPMMKAITSSYDKTLQRLEEEFNKKRAQ